MNQSTCRSSILILVFLLGLSYESGCQYYEYPYEIDSFDFVRYDLNRLQFYDDSSSFQGIFEDFDKLLVQGSGQLSIVHIGGSHLQADVYSDRMRKRMQTFVPGMNGGRGFIFPYKAAHTNNPSNFRIRSFGKWTSCRNVERRKSCTLGLSGIAVSTASDWSHISIYFPHNQVVDYDFNRLLVFFEEDSLSYDFTIDARAQVVEVPEESRPGIRVFRFDRYTDSISIRLQKTADHQKKFTLFGVSLQTDDPGVIYHAIGVNGAKVPSFLRCQLLAEHLVALEPDLVILSLGTNDAYTRYFKPAVFKQEYDSLVDRISRAVPQAAILLTVPNDSYLYRRYANKNTEQVRDVVFELAEENNCGVWNFYDIMGGLNSIIVWQRFGLATRDRIHFTRKGYTLKGDLFFNAFLRSYDDYLDQKNKTAHKQ